METENDPPVAMVTPVKDVILSAATPANALPRWLKKDISCNDNAVSIVTFSVEVHSVHVDGDDDFVVNYRWIEDAIVMFCRELDRLGSTRSLIN